VQLWTLRVLSLFRKWVLHHQHSWCFTKWCIIGHPVDTRWCTIVHVGRPPFILHTQLQTNIWNIISNKSKKIIHMNNLVLHSNKIWRRRCNSSITSSTLCAASRLGRGGMPPVVGFREEVGVRPDSRSAARRGRGIGIICVLQLYSKLFRIV
jgi:hypothetical protein